MFLLLFALWLIFNGRITLEIVIIGAVICSAIYFFCCRFMGFSFKKDKKILKEIPYIVQYIGNLLFEVVKAAVLTSKLIFKKEQPKPSLIKFKTDLKTNTARVLLANSITLTPGTITVDLVGNEYTIHCLDKSFGDGIDESSFVKLLRKMEEVADD